MTAKNILYAIARGLSASLFTAIFFCLVFYRTGPEREDNPPVESGNGKTGNQ